MSRNATGQVLEVPGKHGTVYALRFRAYGRREYLTLGPVGHDAAERELRHVLADVERGTWKPSRPVEGPREVPTFRVFASEWFERQKLEGGSRGGGLSPAGIADLEWRLSNHLLPWFASMHLDEITVKDVDRFRLAKVRDRDAIDKAAAKGKPLTASYTDPRTGQSRTRRRTALGADAINKTIGTLASVLEAAVEYETIPRNVARGRRRRLSTTTPTRAWIDRAEHVSALLAAAGALDATARVRRGQRRALIAVLVFAGLRIAELLALRWRDVDIARGTITIGDAKTAAGVRTVNVIGVLRDELLAYTAREPRQPNALVFATSRGTNLGATNVRRRILAPAVRLANEQLAKGGRDLLPAGLTPHSLRRTFASILFALGEAPPYVSAQMGHTKPSFTLALYARAMDRRDGEPERLKALVEGADWTTGEHQKERRESPRPTDPQRP